MDVEQIMTGLSIHEEIILHKVIMWKRSRKVERMISPQEYAVLNDFLKGYVCELYGIYSDIESEDFMRGRKWAELEKLVGL